MKSKLTVEQSGAIPYRFRNGALEILIVTTRSNKAWTIPKGHIATGVSASESALKEAWEEAGIQGKIIRQSIGSYVYEKRRKKYNVTVFMLEEGVLSDRWPEDTFRKREWFTIKVAQKMVGRKGLKSLLERLEDNLALHEKETFPSTLPSTLSEPSKY